MEETKREYKDERFEFSIYVNNNVICKRNFKINNFIEGSMQAIDFKYAIDNIVNMIDEDLKSKSRVYTWYYFDENEEGETEFNSELSEPWETTFKIVVTDNKKDVITKIWDGRYYPKAIRDKVDLANKNVKFTTKEGKTYIYDKETYFEDNKDRLSSEMYILRAMIMDKPDLLFTITKKICEVCSPREELYHSIGDYTMSEDYKSFEYEKEEDGTLKAVSNLPKKKYFYSIDAANNKLAAEWGKVVAEKTKEYNASLYV